MLSAILIDDQLDALECLALELELYHPDEVKMLAQCPDAITGLSAIKKYRPDLVFVDIDMPYMSGIDLIRLAHAEGYQNTAFVITTGHEEYAIEAFKQEATHYLLKPWRAADLKEAVRRAQEKKTHCKPNATIAPVFMFVTRQDGKEYLPYSEIVLFEAEGNYTNIYCDPKLQKEKNHPTKAIKLVSKSLKNIEATVKDATFMRVHYSYLVNLCFVEKYQDGKITLKTYPDKVIPVSKDHRGDFLRRMDAL